MDANSFLKDLLAKQEVKDTSKEMVALLEERAKVEKLIHKFYESEKPTILFGGSIAKDTMILESYDLDLPIYFDTHHLMNKTLEEIFNEMAIHLGTEYFVQKKRSALRLRKKGDQEEHEDFRIDVVPGRYSDATRTDAFLYVNDSSDKERLKTNLQTHIDHVKNSGFTAEISLLKLWKVRNVIDVKTFILELLVVKILDDLKFKEGLASNIKRVWEFLRDDIDNVSLEDPANPSGNDLSKIFNGQMKADLKAAAKSALKKIELSNGWYDVFNEKKPEAQRAPSVYVSPEVNKIKPYCASKPWGKF